MAHLSLVIDVPAELRQRIIDAVLAKLEVKDGGEEKNLDAVEEAVKNQYLYQVLFEIESKAASEAAVEETRTRLLKDINSPPLLREAGAAD